MQQPSTRWSAVVLSALLALPAVAQAGALPGLGDALFVCKETGDNKNAGTKDAPFKNLDAAVKKAMSGQTVAVCGGVYSGTFDIGFIEFPKALKLYGGFTKDFSARDPVANATLFQPDNESGAKSRKALWQFKGEVDGLVVDGFVFDMGQRNSYHRTEGKPDGVDTGMLTIAPAKGGDDKPTVAEPCLSISSSAKGGNVVIQNNVFANCAMFAIQAGVRDGTFTVKNNVFLANRMTSAELYGTCATKGSGPKAKLSTVCGHVEFANNTVLFTWSRVKDFLDMGYGFDVKTGLTYDVHDNIFGGNIQGGMRHALFSENELKIDRNVFFGNKAADFEYSPNSNTKLTLRVAQFGDLEFASVKDNTDKIPAGLPVDKAYLEGMLAARYSEKADYDANSPANQFREAMGLNKQGKLTTKVSMFANRYPVADAGKFFGAVKDVGAQAIP